MQAIGLQQFFMQRLCESAQAEMHGADHGAPGMLGCWVSRETMWRESSDPEPITGHLIMDQTLLYNTLMGLSGSFILHEHFRPVSLEIDNRILVCQQLKVLSFLKYCKCMKVPSFLAELQLFR